MAESGQPVANIVGEQIALGPLRREVMAELDLQWGNDFEVTMTLGQPPGPVTAEMVTARSFSPPQPFFDKMFRPPQHKTPIVQALPACYTRRDAQHPIADDQPM